MFAEQHYVLAVLVASRKNFVSAETVVASELLVSAWAVVAWTHLLSALEVVAWAHNNPPYNTSAWLVYVVVPAEAAEQVIAVAVISALLFQLLWMLMLGQCLLLDRNSHQWLV